MKNQHLNFILFFVLFFPILLFLNSCGSAEEDILAPNQLVDTPPDIIVDCDQVPTPPTVYQSNNNLPVSFSEITIPGPCPFTYQIERTWAACDLSHTQTVSVSDNTDPVIVGAPADITIDCNATIPTVAPVTATDNCDDNVSIEFNEVISNVNGCAQTITRTWTATDDCGNVTTVTQIIIIS